MKAIYTLIILASVVGCTAAPKPLPKGKCETNVDCPGGQLCEAGRCQDIYYPRRERLPYM